MWDEVPLLSGPAPGDGRGDEVLEVHGLRLMELIDSAWGALVGWAFGPAALRRFVDDRQRVVTIHHNHGGVRTVERHPWSAQDFEEHREDIDAYLAEAGAPPRPLGYVWYLVLPPGRTPEQIWSGMNDQQRISPLPAVLGPLLRVEAARLSGRPDLATDEISD